MAQIFECLRCSNKSLLLSLPARCPNCGYAGGIIHTDATISTPEAPTAPDPKPASDPTEPDATPV